jgi:restriction system protein
VGATVGSKRGRSKQIGKPGPIIAVAGALLILWLLSSALQQTGALISILIASAVVGFAGYAFFSAPHKGLQQKLALALDSHKDALATRRAQLVYRDAYGNPQLKRWNAEIDHFLNNVVGPTLTSRERQVLTARKTKLTIHVEQKVSEQSASNSPLHVFSESMTPSQYEAYCAEELKRHGWDAAVTKGSRDQGVDVVASKSGIRVVLQCKLYSQPVGNKAVQEVVAARNYERASFGIVVSNNSYTAPAQALASVNGVYLLHHRELAGLEALIGKCASGSQTGRTR